MPTDTKNLNILGFGVPTTKLNSPEFYILVCQRRQKSCLLKSTELKVSSPLIIGFGISSGYSQRLVVFDIS